MLSHDEASPCKLKKYTANPRPDPFVEVAAKKVSRQCVALRPRYELRCVGISLRHPVDFLPFELLACQFVV